MNIAEKIEAKVKAFLDKPISIPLKDLVFILSACLALGSTVGLFAPTIAWVFIIVCIMFALSFLIPYFASKSEESHE